MSNPRDYEKWGLLCAGELPPIHEDEPLCGFWRGKNTEGKFDGIAVWRGEDGELKALRDHRRVRIDQVWPWYAKHPVTESAYRVWESTGVWPDEHAIAPAPPRDDNEPADEAEMLCDQIESARAGAADYSTVTSDEQASKAQSLRSRLLELSREADNKRVAEKAPHLAAGKAVDSRWMSMVNAAQDAAVSIAKAMSAWETTKARRAAEAQRKADEERRRQEEEARKAAEAAKPAPEPVLQLEPDPAPPPTTQIRGGYGRAAAVKVVKVVRVVDQLAAYRQLETDPEIIALIAKLAQRTVDRGFEMAGVEITEERKVA